MKQEKQVARGALMNQRRSAIASRLPLLLLRLNETKAKQKVAGVTFNGDVQGELNDRNVTFFPTSSQKGGKEKRKINDELSLFRFILNNSACEACRFLNFSF